MQPTQSMPPQFPRKKRRLNIALLVIGAMLGAAALTGGGLYLGGVFATEFVAEPFDSPGVDPFGGSVGDGQSVPITPVAQIQQQAAAAPPPAQPAAVTPPQPAAPVTTAAAPPASAAPGSTTVSGDTVGLYGGTNQNACDAAKLVAFLKANPDKARAWATVELVPPDQIEAFVATLTPVILRTDTAVINHGFRDGVANPFNSVLQAGTAVMVDRNGVPRVRCKCGNPLLPPKKFGQVKYGGTKWWGFDERNITYIERSRVEITQFRVVMLCNCGYGPPPGIVPPPPPVTSTPTKPAAACGEYRDGTCVAPAPLTSRRVAPTTTRAPAAEPGTGGGGGGGGGGGAAEPAAPGGGAADDGGASPGDGGGDRPAPPQVPDGGSGESF
ncbi:DUF6777 domain-containing protein [Actinomycetospora termitidis]|uniref:DUF6777 domain-containing protein n=1 Tax=Actinomycetospora termitidis TaxID=3053470 RepID=A0ABT7M127_9PSEU|nr:DUF6777 domain-containing protein [Actinomycetospora sp. Odt1-22]MDL5154370.1 hypothetical protein [Actinomycetospora sp. Odt1-22]